MTDYTKENHWYGWNGGECPVHPETEVEIINTYDRRLIKKAKNFTWGHTEAGNGIVCFRITRLYVEPRKAREWWMNLYPDIDACVYDSKSDADHYAATTRIDCVHVREVLEGE